MNLEEYEQIQPNVEIDGMRFWTPNKHCAWRIQTLYTKEADTIEWLKSMKPGEILWDIGANIGQYTIFAAKRGVNVVAFEPESQNFAILQRNLHMNNFQAFCQAYPICLSDEQHFDVLRLSGLMPGGSCHSFGTDQNFKGEVKQWNALQGSVAFTGDSLVLDHGFARPNHIKIDVDGLENQVLRGLAQTLLHADSVLVEMDSAQTRHMEWKERLETEYGFRTNQAQIDIARRTDGPFTGIGNIIFYKRDDIYPGTLLPHLGTVAYSSEANVAG